MNFKNIQKKLTDLRDRIRSQGSISEEDEKELKSLLSQTLMTANSELEGVQKKLDSLPALKAQNDNAYSLNDDQKSRLDLITKTGTGSAAIH